MSGQLAILVELLEGAPSHLTSCLVELICNCAELPAAREVRHLQLSCPFKSMMLQTSLYACKLDVVSFPFAYQSLLIAKVLHS